MSPIPSPQAVRIFHLQPGQPAHELQTMPTEAAPSGFYWIACTRDYLSSQLAPLQASLLRLTGFIILAAALQGMQPLPGTSGGRSERIGIVLAGALLVSTPS